MKRYCGWWAHRQDVGEMRNVSNIISLPAESVLSIGIYGYTNHRNDQRISGRAIDISVCFSCLSFGDSRKKCTKYFNSTHNPHLKRININHISMPCSFTWIIIEVTNFAKLPLMTLQPTERSIAFIATCAIYTGVILWWKLKDMVNIWKGQINTWGLPRPSTMHVHLKVLWGVYIVH